jgi:outer membrane immunogenic protein
MKRFILAATAIVSAATLTTAARAADIAPAAYDWSGFYVGLNAGAAWNNTEVDHDFEYVGGDLPGPILADDINDRLDDVDTSLGSDEAVFTGGALFGYNWQHDALVLGVEADINYAGFGNDETRDISDELDDLLGETSGTIDGTARTSFEAEWFGTLRGRLGFAADNFLIYGTGGLAYGHMEASLDIDAVDTNDSSYAGSYSGSTSSTNWGWTAGAGVEYGIDNWSLGIEYLYVDLGSAEWDGDLIESADDTDSALLANVEGNGEVDYQFSVVRATAKIRF